MIRKTVVIAVGALACVAFASSASAAKKHHAAHAQAPAAHAEAPAAQAEAIPGVNPMTNANPTPAVEHPAAYTKVPGVNPM